MRRLVLAAEDANTIARSQVVRADYERKISERSNVVSLDDRISESLETELDSIDPIAFGFMLGAEAES